MNHLFPDLEKQLVERHSKKCHLIGTIRSYALEVIAPNHVFPTPKISPDESLMNEIHKEFPDLSLVLVKVTDIVTGSIPFRNVTGQTSLGFV